MFHHLHSALIVNEKGGAENNKQPTDGTLTFQASEPITSVCCRFKVQKQWLSENVLKMRYMCRKWVELTEI